MRWSEWRAKAPFKDSVAPKVVAVVGSAALGAEPDPSCWVIWGDVPNVRYLILTPTVSGLAQVNVRVAVAGEGPRAGGKIVRWSRVHIGELGVEIQAGHRLVTLQVETFVLSGADLSADAIAAFAQTLFAAVDGRPMPDAGKAKKARPGRAGAAAKSTARAKPGTTAKPATPAKPATTAKAVPRLTARKGSST